MAGGAFTSHMIEILIKTAGTDKAKADMASVASAGADANKKVANAAKQQAALFQGLSASMARIMSVIPAGNPLGDLTRNLIRAGGASIGTANAMKGLGLDLGKVALIAGGVVAGILAIGAAAKTMVAGVRAAADSQESIIKLGNALRTQGIYTKEAETRATAFANAMQAVTKYTDEEILSTQALLAQLGRLSGTALEDATKATLDLAAGLGRELPVAALIMAKAAQGSTWELRKYGLVVDENIPRTQKWAMALRFVQEEFGGRAQADLKGFNAQMRQFAGAFKDVLTVIGAPVIIPLTKALKESSQSMLAWAAARQQMLNQQLTGGVPDLDAAFKAYKKAREEYNKAISMDVNARAFGETSEQARFAYDELAKTNLILQEQQGNLQAVINEYAKFAPVKEALATLARLTQDAAAAEKKWLAALSTHDDKKIREQQRAWGDALEIAGKYRAAIRRRFETGEMMAVDELNSIISAVNLFGMQRDKKLTFEGDVELSEVREQLKEVISDPQWKINLQQLDTTKIDAAIAKLKQEFDEALAVGDVDKIESAADRLRDAVVTARAKLSIDDPASTYLIDRGLDVLYNHIAQRAPAVVRVKLEAEDTQQIVQLAKTLKQTVALTDTDIQLIDPREYQNVKTLEQAYGALRKAMLDIQGKPPDDVVKGWNTISGAVATMTMNTEEGRAAQKAFIDELERDFLPLAIQAQEELTAIAFDTQVKGNIPEIKQQIRLFMNKEEWSNAELAIQRLREWADKLKLRGGPEGEALAITLLLEADKFEKDLGAAQSKAEAFREETSTLKTTIDLAIQVKDWDLAMKKVADLEALGEKLTSEELKLILRLQVEKYKQDIEEAKITNDQFLSKLQSDMNSTLDNINSMPWNAPADLFSAMFESMASDSVEFSDMIMRTFTNMINEIISGMIRLKFMTMAAGGVGGGGGFLGGIFSFLGFGNKPETQFDLTNLPKKLFANAPRQEVIFPSVGIAPINAPKDTTPSWQKPNTEWRRKVDIKIDALDSSSIRRSLETGALGRELSRVMR